MLEYQIKTVLLNQLIIRSIWECIFLIVNKEKYLLFLLRSTTKKKKKKKKKRNEMKKFKRVRILTATSSFQVEWSNWGSYGKTVHFSFNWAKPTLQHSFYTVVPIVYFTILPIAQFSAAKVWFWIIIKQEDHIAHLSKQICILTVEVSAKFTTLRFMYKFYSPAPPPPPHPIPQAMFFLF